MGKHSEAAAALEKIPDPKAKPNSDEEKQYRSVQLNLARQYRLSKDKALLKKARDLLTPIMDGKGWGRGDLSALTEDGLLMEAEERYIEAFNRWDGLRKRLSSQMGRNPALKDRYLECYLRMIVSYYRFGLTKPSKEDRDKFTAATAAQLAGLERSYGDDFGGEALKKQVIDLLSSEQGLKAAFEAARKK